MNIMMKRIVTILMAITFAFGLSSVCFAVEEEPYDPGIIDEQPYEIITSLSSSISIKNSTAKCNATIRASGASKVTIKMELQKKSNGSYSTVKTWTTSAAGSSAALSKSKAISSGGVYRLKTTFTAKKGNTSESSTQYKSA